MALRVRFRDLLPVGTKPLEDPIFSPLENVKSCREKNEEPTILHSIFSPKQIVPAHGSQMKRQRPNDKHSVGSRQYSAAGKNENVQREESLVSNHLALGGSDGTTPRVNNEHKSPLSFGGMSGILISPSNTALSSLAVSMDFSSLCSPTTTSIMMNTSDTSTKSATTAFRTLEKMEWLQLEYIQQCRSISQLVRIIAVLQAERQSYPYLLRAAREQLCTLRGPLLHKSSINEQTQQPSSPDTVIEEVIRSCTTGSCCSGMGQFNAQQSCETQSHSSLVMSLSTDADDEQVTLRSLSIRPSPRAESIVDPTVTTAQLELQEQVKRLTQTIIEMERIPLLNTSHAYNILQKENECRMVAQHHVQSGANIEEFLKIMEDLREQNRKLEEDYRNEKMAHASKSQANADIEKRLSMQLKNLQAQLTASCDKSKKAECNFQRKQFEMNQLLRNAQRHLERVKADRDAMIQCLLQATGRQRNEAATLSPSNQKQLMEDICNRTASNQRALDVMTRQLKESDHHRRTVIQKQKETESHLIETVQSVQRLQNENTALLKQIQSLSEQLSVSRKQLDEMYKSGQEIQRIEYEERERKYKSIISEMKNQLRKRENVVPVGLFRTAVAEAKMLAAECKSYKENVSNLTSKVAFLENELINQSDRNVTQSPFLTEMPRIDFPETPEREHGNSTKADKIVPQRHPMPKDISSTSSIETDNDEMHGLVLQYVSPNKKMEKNVTKKVRIISPNTNTPIHLDSAVRCNSLQASEIPLDNENRITYDPAVLLTKTPTGSTQTPAKSADGGILRSSLVRAAGGRRALQQKLRAMRSPKQASSCSFVKDCEHKLKQMGIQPKPLRESVNRLG